MVVDVRRWWASAVMSGVKIRADNAASVLAGLDRLSKMDVLVGIPEGPQREDAPLSNAQLGYLQATGATVEIDGSVVTLPPRPFLDIGIEDSQAVTTQHLESAARHALAGDFRIAEKELESAGIVASMAAQRVIGDGDRLAPLSKITAARRIENGQDIKPLYDTGKLKASITYVVRGKK